MARGLLFSAAVCLLLIAADARATECASPRMQYDLAPVTRTIDGVDVGPAEVPAVALSAQALYSLEVGVVGQVQRDFFELNLLPVGACPAELPANDAVCGAVEGLKPLATCSYPSVASTCFVVCQFGKWTRVAC